MIIARTDSARAAPLAGGGREEVFVEALARCVAFEAAGADVVYAEGLETEDEMRRPEGGASAARAARAADSRAGAAFAGPVLGSSSKPRTPCAGVWGRRVRTRALEQDQRGAEGADDAGAGRAPQRAAHLDGARGAAGVQAVAAGRHASERADHRHQACPAGALA